MSIVEDYSRQYRWRAWPTILDALPAVDGQLVLDLGSGIGDLAADLAARGARVIGLDINEEFVTFATQRRIKNAEFRVADLRTFFEPSLRVDGIWSSFTAAYFPSFRDTAASWIKHLRPGAWLALTEVDDLFAHQPVLDRTRELLSRYAQDSVEHSRYDFRMGSKIAAVLEELDLKLLHNFTVPDQELSFSGQASSEVVAAWRTRFDRMRLLRDSCGSEFEEIRDDFLNCLTLENHSCTATMRCVIAVKP